jgi:hypothetical protein
MNLYEEKIIIRKTWVGALILTSLLLSVLVVAVSIVADPNTKYTSSIIAILIIVEVTLFILFLFAKLIIKIDVLGISYQWFPLMIKQSQVNWDTVTNAWVRKSKPLKEFGGWGIKGSRKNRAINVSGDWGLQLVLMDERRIFIETQKPEDIKQVLVQLASKGIRGMNQEPNE